MAPKVQSLCLKGFPKQPRLRSSLVNCGFCSRRVARGHPRCPGRTIFILNALNTVVHCSALTVSIAFCQKSLAELNQAIFAQLLQIYSHHNP